MVISIKGNNWEDYIIPEKQEKIILKQIKNNNLSLDETKKILKIIKASPEKGFSMEIFIDGEENRLVLHAEYNTPNLKKDNYGTTRN